MDRVVLQYKIANVLLLTFKSRLYTERDSSNFVFTQHKLLYFNCLNMLGLSLLLLAVGLLCVWRLLLLKLGIFCEFLLHCQNLWHLLRDPTLSLVKILSAMLQKITFTFKFDCFRPIFQFWSLNKRVCNTAIASLQRRKLFLLIGLLENFTIKSTILNTIPEIIYLVWFLLFNLLLDFRSQFVKLRLWY